MSIESINQGLGRELQCENHDNTISLIRQENNLSNNCISENILHYDLETPTVFSVTCKLMEEFQPHSVPSWHSLFDELQRDIMRENIFQLILQRRSNPSPEWVRNLEDVAKRLEERLYYAASSLEDYQNTRTLVAR